MSILRLKNDLSDIGVVKKSVISDGTTNFDCEIVDLKQALLIKVNEAFYLDYTTHLKVLDKNDLKLYNIDRYFDIEEVEIKKRRIKK